MGLQEVGLTWGQLLPLVPPEGLGKQATRVMWKKCGEWNGLIRLHGRPEGKDWEATGQAEGELSPRKTNLRLFLPG